MFANDLRNRLTSEAKPTLFSIPNAPPTVGTKRRVIEKIPVEASHSQGKILNIFKQVKNVLLKFLSSENESACCNLIFHLTAICSQEA